MYKIETKLRQWILGENKKHNNAYIPLDFILWGVLILAGIVIRIVCVDYITQDMRGFLLKWYEQIKAGGGFRALSQEIGNYASIYYVLMAIVTYIPMEPVSAIKLISIVFDVVLSVGVGFVVWNKDKKSKNALCAGVITWLLPTVILNSAMWGQADAIYSAFLIWTAYFVLKKNYPAAMFVWGLSFGFKLQAVFWLPVLLLLWFWDERCRLWHYMMAIVAYITTMIPAAIAGRSFKSQIKTYILQMQDNDVLTLNMPNIYTLLGKSEVIDENVSMISTLGILATMLCLGILLYYLIIRVKEWSSSIWLKAVLLSVLIINFLLPHMHERYTYSAIIVSVILVFFERKYIYVSGLVFVHAFFACCVHLLNSKPIDFRILAVLLGGIIVYLVYDIGDSVRMSERQS